LCGLREEEKGERREMGFGKKKVKRRESKNDGRLKMKRKENKKKKFKEKKITWQSNFMSAPVKVCQRDIFV